MKLTLAVAHDRLTTLEGVRAEVTLENDGAAALELPGTSDRTDALTLEARRPDGTLIARMNGLTRQALMSTGRVNETPLLETLEAGARWTWLLDLARYHYPLPAGPCRLTAHYHYAPAEVRLSSAPVELEVGSAAPRELVLLEDAPVLDTLTLLFRAEEESGAPLTVLRQHNAGRPLAAWYSSAVEGPRARVPANPPIAWDGPTRPFLAAARYRTTESFDPSFVKWLITTDGSKVRAYCFEWARPDPRAASAPLPEGLELIDSASYDEEHRLWLALRRRDGVVEIHEMQPGRLAKLCELPLPPTPRPPALRWDCDHLHVLAPDQGGVYYRFTHDGTLERELRVTGSALPLHSLSLDPFRRIFRLIHFEPAWGELRRPAIELAAIGPEPEDLAYLRLDDPLPDRALTELAVDVDDGGGFHLLAGTDRGELYYLRPGAAPHVLATGEPRWFPIVRAGRGVRVGYHQARVGYRFVRLREGRVLPLADVAAEASS